MLPPGKMKIKEKIESDPGITIKSELETEEEILEDIVREELSEIFEETDNQMNKKIEENNKILEFLTDNQQLSKEELFERAFKPPAQRRPMLSV